MPSKMCLEANKLPSLGLGVGGTFCVGLKPLILIVMGQFR